MRRPINPERLRRFQISVNTQMRLDLGSRKFMAPTRESQVDIPEVGVQFFGLEDESNLKWANIEGSIDELEFPIFLTKF